MGALDGGKGLKCGALWILRLRARAYYVKPHSKEAAEGHRIDKTGHVFLSWQSHGGVQDAAKLACSMAGWPPESEEPSGDAPPP